MQAKATLGGYRWGSLLAEASHRGGTPAGNPPATDPGPDCRPEPFPSGQESSGNHLEAAGLHHDMPWKKGEVLLLTLLDFLMYAAVPEVQR